MRRPLILALVGLILFSLLDWNVNNEISQYQQSGKAKNYYEALTSGAVFLGLRDNMICVWNWIDDNHDVLLVIFAAALFLVTAFLVRYTKNLWGSTDDLVSDSKKATKRQLRAYVGVVYPEVTIDREANRLIAVIHYKNSGQSPAQDVQIHIAADIFNGTPEWTDPPTDADSWKGGILMPGTTWQRYCPVKEEGGIVLTDELKKEILGLNSPKKIWVWGNITYSDSFEDRWEIRYRFRSGNEDRDPEQRPSFRGTGRSDRFIPLISELANSKLTWKGKKA